MSANPTITPYVAVPAPTVASVAQINTWSTDLTALLSKEQCQVVSPGTGQSIPNLAWAQATGGTVQYDPYGIFNTSTNEVTLGWGGLYDIQAFAVWAGNTTNRRDITVQAALSGTIYICSDFALPSVGGPGEWPNETAALVDTMITSQRCHLGAGTVLGFYVEQDTGAALELKQWGMNVTWLSN
jgi:hypothetical protein